MGCRRRHPRHTLQTDPPPRRQRHALRWHGHGGSSVLHLCLRPPVRQDHHRHAARHTHGGNGRSIRSTYCTAKPSTSCCTTGAEQRTYYFRRATDSHSDHTCPCRKSGDCGSHGDSHHHIRRPPQRTQRDAREGGSTERTPLHRQRRDGEPQPHPHWHQPRLRDAAQVRLTANHHTGLHQRTDTSHG